MNDKYHRPASETPALGAAERLTRQNCPYQKGLSVIICEANCLLVPSVEEQMKYCKGDFRECPYYLDAISGRTGEVTAEP